MIDEFKEIWNYDPIRFDMHYIIPIIVPIFIGIIFYIISGHDHQMTNNMVCHFSPGHMANGDNIIWEMI